MKSSYSWVKSLFVRLFVKANNIIPPSAVADKLNDSPGK